MARIAVIDDDRMLCALWQKVFMQQGHEARCFHQGDQAVRCLSSTPSDVAVVDLVMPGMNGLECIERLRTNQSAAHFLLVSGHLTGEVTEQAHQLGIQQALFKPCSPTDLIAAIESLLGTPANAHGHGNDRVLPRDPPALPQFPCGPLTRREREILGLLQRKLSDKEIAMALAISYRTVQCHVQNIFHKVQACTRQEAVEKCFSSNSAAGHNLPLGQICHGDGNFNLGIYSGCQITPRD